MANYRIQQEEQTVSAAPVVKEISDEYDPEYDEEADLFGWDDEEDD